MKAQVKQFITEELLNGQVPVEDEQELLLSGLIDSMGIMQLVAFIENHLQLQVPPEDVTIENFSSIAAIAEYGNKLMAG